MLLFLFLSKRKSNEREWKKIKECRSFFLTLQNDTYNSTRYWPYNLLRRSRIVVHIIFSIIFQQQKEQQQQCCCYFFFGSQHTHTYIHHKIAYNTYNHNQDGGATAWRQWRRQHTSSCQTNEQTNKQTNDDSRMSINSHHSRLSVVEFGSTVPVTTIALYRSSFIFSKI